MDQILSARELRITEAEHSALMKFVEKAPLIPQGKDDYDLERAFGIERDPPTEFNMQTIRCGSVACIKGWLPWLEPKLPKDYKETNTLFGLFFPGGGYDASPYIATAIEAARVVSHFLRTGEIDWDRMNG